MEPSLVSHTPDVVCFELFCVVSYEDVACRACVEQRERSGQQTDALEPLLLLGTGQSQAINRFVARLTGFYPADPLQAAHVDAVIDGASDLVPAVMKVGVGLDQAAKEAARLEACKSGRVSGLLFAVS